jgi:mRNA interferase RelE/StbE
MYRVEVRPAASRELDRIDTQSRERILAAIRELGRDPRPGGCLKLASSELWRIRVGDYRVVYEIRDQVLLVLVVRVAHRREAYR